MKTLDIGNATGTLAELARRPDREPLILTVAGKPVAVLLPVKDADVETVSLSFNPQFLAIIEDSRRSQEREGGLTTDELRREFGLPPYDKGKSKAPRGNHKKNHRTRKPGGKV